MKFALDSSGARITASPGAQGHCPGCSGALVAKCGSIIEWHWAHTTGPDCDPWAEPDSVWHQRWQDLVPAERREVVMGPHRADVVSPDGVVVELQHSTIPVREINARESHYGRMAWIFDAIDAYRTGRLSVRDRGEYVSFRWMHPRKSIAACKQTVFLDLGNGRMLRVQKISTKAPCGGWGKLFQAQEIINWLNPGQVVPHVGCRMYEQPSDYGFHKIIAQCNRCGHQAARTYQGRPLNPDINRILVKMGDECPRGERNFYAEERS